MTGCAGVSIAACAGSRSCIPEENIYKTLLVLTLALLISSACAQVATPSPTPFTCPVTLPNGQTPPLETNLPGYHGNGFIWTVLPEDGILRIPAEMVEADGTLTWKAPWWRSPQGATLTLTGRRLDAAAPPFETRLPAGYTDYVQSVGWFFPAQGCWEITGQTAEASLVVVVQVVASP